MLFVIFLIDGNGTHLVVHPAVPFDGGTKEHPVVLSLELKEMTVAAIFHSGVCDVGCDGPV